MKPFLKLFFASLLLLSSHAVACAQGNSNNEETPIGQWQFTASWYFGLLPDYEVIQPIKLMDVQGNDVTAECLNKVTFTTSAESSIAVQQVPAGHSSGMTGYWMLKAGQTTGNASITGSYSGPAQWGQSASATFTVFCGDPYNSSWLQNNMFGIDPLLVYAAAGSTVDMPTITVNGSRNVLTDFDIIAVRSSDSNNVTVIEPAYSNAGVLLHGYQFNVKNTTATRIWIEVKGKGNFEGYWAKIYFNINGMTKSGTGSDNGVDVNVVPWDGSDPGTGGEGGETPAPAPTASYAVKIPVPNYVLASGQTIHQTPSVIKTEKGNNGTLTDTNVSDKYTFSYTCDRPDYAYVAADGTVTALKEIKEPVYINVKATPTDAGVAAGCKEASASYSVQIYTSESVIRLNPTTLTIPMKSAEEGEQRLVPSMIMKVNGVVYEPNLENTYDLSYEGFDPSIVTLVDKDGKVQGEDGFSMPDVMYFKALKAGTTQGIVHAKGKGINSGFWGTAPFSITVTPYVPSGSETPAEGAIREISVPVPFYTMAYGNTIQQRIRVKEYADAEAKKNNQYTDVTSQYALSYTSSNEQIATVDENGIVTAMADNVNPAYIKVIATPIGEAPAVSPTSFGVKVFGGASVISLSSKSVSLAPNELVPLPEVFVIVNGMKYSSENAFNVYYEAADQTKAVVVNNEKLRGVAVGNTPLNIKVIGKGEFEGFYCTAVVDVNVRVSETLDGTNTWYWAQDGARSAIYDLYPGKQLHFEFTNKTMDTGKSDAGWTFVASKTLGYSDQAFLAANPFANLMTWDGWGENANPQPVVKVNNADHALTNDEMNQFKSDLANAKVDYIVALAADGKTLSVHATIEAKNAQDKTVRTYRYDIDNKQLSYQVGVLPVYFSSVRSTIETLRLVPQQYTATVAVDGEGGTVKILVNGEEQKNGDDSYKPSVTVDEGSHVVFMAVPNGNSQAGGSDGRYYFVKWTEDNSTNITRDFYIDHNISLTATFRADEKKWLEVTTDGQDYLLNQDNYNNDFYFKTLHNGEIVAEENWTQILGQSLTSMHDNHSINLYVRGAKAFKVYAYDGNGVESNYTVRVDNGEQTTVSHHGTALETSQIFSISNPIAVNAEGTDYNTITLAANDNQLYPFLVQFFTKEPIQQTANRQYVTVADDSADTAIAASALATGGTLTSVTYSNQSDKDIATVEVSNDGKLVVTGHKAGNILVKLNFTGNEIHSAASFDYTIIVKKRDLRLSWSKKSINLHYNASPEAPQSRGGSDYSQFATLTLTEYNLDGSTTEIGAEDPLRQKISFSSTNTSLINFSGNTPTFGRKTGTADLIARISEDEQVLDNTATVCVNITPMGGIYYEVKTDDKPEEGDGLQKELTGEDVVASIDMHVYKYNRKLSDVPADGKVKRETKDIWGDVKEYQGSDAMKKVWYMDGFSNNTQGNQNAMNEHFRILEPNEEDKNEYRIRFVGENTYTTVQPFSLPVRGSFVKFEALQNGTLICYSLQNGNLNFNHISEYESKKSSPLAGNPRLYYWFDQEGNNLQNQITASTLQPFAIGRRDDLPELTKSLTDWITKEAAERQAAGLDDNGEIKTWYSNFPSQWDVDRNLEKDEPAPQSILQYKGGYSIMNKAYVKYEVPVRMGNTYYFFSNDSKVAFAGVKFVPDAQQPTETLTMTQSDDWSARENGNNTNGMAQHKGKSFATATLQRSFTKNQWNTICLPFNVSEKQVEDVFGVGTQLLIYDGIKNTEGQNIAQFLRHVDQNILAGQPYFIYATGVDKEGHDLSTVSEGKIQSLTFHNITVPADLQIRSYGNDDEDGLRMIGTLSKTPVAKYDYYVNANTGAITRYTGSGTTMNTYRAFLQQTHPAQAKTMNFGFTDIEAEAMGTPTGLIEVISDLGVGKKQIQDGVYNINGQKVSITTENLNHGVYIVDGKKYTK